MDFSPQIWWIAMDRGIEFTNHLAKDFNKLPRGRAPKY